VKCSPAIQVQSESITNEESVSVSVSRPFSSAEPSSPMSPSEPEEADIWRDRSCLLLGANMEQVTTFITVLVYFCAHLMLSTILLSPLCVCAGAF
jgi:hypothetical protein